MYIILFYLATDQLIKSIYKWTVEVRQFRDRGGIKESWPYFEYRVHFNDGTSVNVWDETERLYKLHSFAKSKDVKIIHEEVHMRDAEYYLKGDKKKIYEILGM